MSRPFAVLFVCTGNVCRSPAAQVLLQARVDAAGAGQVLSVGSAGLGVGRGIAEGLRIDRTVETLLAKRGVADVDGFRSRPVTGELVDGAGLLLTATREHRLEIGRRWPQVYSRTFTLREAAWMLADRPASAGGPSDVADWLRDQRGLAVPPVSELDIADPIGRRTGVYRRVVEQVSDSVDVIAGALLAPAA